MTFEIKKPWRIDKWAASDGTTHDTFEQALDQERVIALAEYLNDDTATGIYWRDTGPEEVAKAILKMFDITPKDDL